MEQTYGQDITKKYDMKKRLSKISRTVYFELAWGPLADTFRIPGRIPKGYVRCIWRIVIQTPYAVNEGSCFVIEMHKGDNNTIGEGLEVPPPPISSDDILREKIATFRIPHTTKKIYIGNDIKSPLIKVIPDYSDPSNPKNNRIYFRNTEYDAFVYITVDYYDIEG